MCRHRNHESQGINSSPTLVFTAATLDLKKKKKDFCGKIKSKKKNYHPWIFLTALALIIPIVKKIKTYTSRSRPLDSSAEALIFNISNFSPRRTSV